MTTKTICGVKHDYVSPEFAVLEIKTEGVLCASGEGSVTINDWYRDPNDPSIDF